VLTLASLLSSVRNTYPGFKKLRYLFAILLQDVASHISSFPEKALAASQAATWKKVAGREGIGTFLLFCGSWAPKNSSRFRLRDETCVVEYLGDILTAGRHFCTSNRHFMI